MKFLEEHGIDSKAQRRAINSLQRLRELDVINEIRRILQNFKSLIERGRTYAAENKWIGRELDKTDNRRFDILDKQSINRIKRFVELFEIPKENEIERKRIIEYLTNYADTLNE